MDQKQLSEMNKSIARRSLPGCFILPIILGSYYFLYKNNPNLFLLGGLIIQVLFFIVFYLESKITKKYGINWKAKELIKIIFIILFLSILGFGITSLVKIVFGINIKSLTILFPLLGGNFSLSKIFDKEKNLLQLRFSYYMSWMLLTYVFVTFLFVFYLYYKIYGLLG